MFKQIAPQRAQHSDGYVVQVASRSTIEYVGDGLVVSLDADFAAVTGIYPATISAQDKNGVKVNLNDAQRNSILNRIEEGLKCLNVRYEVC